MKTRTKLGAWIGTLALLLAGLAPRVEAAAKQMEITFAGYTNRTDTLTNFPMLVVLTNNMGGSGFDYDNFLDADGYDLRFATNSTSTDWLNYEIESWDTNGASYVWVEVPTIAPDDSSSIYAKWGDSDHSSQLPCTTNGAVWANGFRGVWHLAETGGNAINATRLGGDGTPASVTQDASGAVNGADTFNGTSANYDCGATTVLNGIRTWEAWVHPSNFSSYRNVIGKGYAAGYWFGLVQTSGKIRLHCVGSTSKDSNSAVPLSQWTHIAASYDGANMRFYINGEFDVAQPITGALTTNAGQAAHIGADYLNGSSGGLDFWFPGSLDEIRVSSVVRGSNWVWACHLNQASNTVFNNYGEMTTSGVAGAPEIENRPVSSVTTGGATFNAYLETNGTSAATVSVLWGEQNGAAGGSWANTNAWEAGDWADDSFPSTNMTLSADKTYYYTFAASNGTTNVTASAPVSFISGALTVSASDPTGRTSVADTAAFTVTRPATCTNEDLVVNYTLGGTAATPADYTIAPVSGAVIIAAGQTNGLITVTPVFKQDAEKTVVLTLAAGPYAVGSPNSATCTLVEVTSVEVTWDGSGDTTWGPPPDSTSWSGGTYNDLDTAVFAGAGTGTVNVDSGGVAPGAIDITSGSYEFTNGNITGSGALTNSGSGTLTVGTTYDGLRYTGDTQLDSGTLEIRYSNNGGGGPSQTDRSLGGTTVLNGGTLQFNHVGAGWNNPDLNFTNGITVASGGGTLDYAGGANDFGDNEVGPLTLGGPLTVSGITGNTGIRFNLTSGGITLNTDASITNATGSGGNAHTIALSPDISGPTRTLTLDKSGNGTGFYIDPTSTSLNLANLVVGTNSQLHFDLSGNNVNPLTQIKANSGTLTMQTGSSLTYRPLIDWWDNDGAVFDTSAVVWQGGNTLNFAKGTQGNGDTYHTVTGGNLVVSTAAGLTQLNAIPWRAYLTIASPYVLTVGDGGTLQWTAGSQVQETLRGNMTMLNGATIVGVNSSGNPGGIIRDTTGGGTLTLGDGSAAVVTVQGNHATDTDSFNLGWPAANVTDNGNVAMRYANTGSGAGDFFNVGWSDGGSYAAALTAFRESSGGTEFAPVAGSAGVAIVGPSSGTVATFAKTGTVTTAGTVGFYNEINANQRGSLGEVVVASGGLLTITNDGGTVAASTLTVDGGTVSGVGTFSVTDAAFTNGGVYSVVITGAQITACGQITASGTLTFLTGGTLAIDTNAYAPNATEFWDIATAGTIADLPSVPAGWSVQDLSGTLRLTKLASATAAVVENLPVTDVTATSATFNGFLHSTGTAATVVTLYWGEVDKGDTATGWDHTNDFGERGVAALITNLTTLVQDRYYYYRFKADNGTDAWDAEGGEAFITGDITVTGTTDGEEVGPVTGVFTLSRGSVLTNEDLVVTYEMSGDAIEGTDYEAVSGVVTILQGQASATVDIVPIPDPDVEGNEIVWLSLLAGPYDSSALASNSILIIDRPAADLEWTDGDVTGAWNTNDFNWTDGAPAKFSGGDNVTFGGTAQGTVTVDAGGVTPGSIAVTNGSYTFAGGDITGSGGLVKSGSGTLGVGYTYTGLDYSGDTRIDAGIVRIDHNSGGGGATERSLGGTTVLNGGTLRLNHTGAGSYNPTLTFTNGIQVNAAGGAIDFAGSANAFYNTLGAPTLGGPLTVTGVTGNPSGNGSPYNFTNGTLTLTADAAITNNTTKPSGAAHAVVLSPDMSGSAHTLTLATAGTGGGFQISGATASSIDLAALTVGAGSSLSLWSVANGVNPLSQIKSNGGTLTMGAGSSLGFPTTASADGPIFDTSAVVWQGGNTLTFARSGVGNQDSFVRIANGDLTVSTAAGLTQLNAIPWRAYYTIDAPNALIVGDGGTLQWTAGSQARETVRGNITLLDGAILHGWNVNNSLNETAGQPGGLIRDTTDGGTLTLGDGSASVITVQGNHYADPDSFNLGWPAANVTDNGNVTVRYANTSATAGEYFNVGWSDGGSYAAALTAFRETSGGTEFAPLAGSGGVAVVGPASGTVAIFSNPVAVSSGGTVGFYNEINTNQRDSLGAVDVAAGNTLTFNTNGVAEASDMTFGAGSTLAVTIVGSETNDVGYLRVSGTLDFTAGTTLTVANPQSFGGAAGWSAAEATTISGLPTVGGGYDVGVEAGSPQRLKVWIPAGTLFKFR